MKIKVRNTMTNEQFISKIKLIDDQTRLKLLQLLAKNGTMCGCKLVEELKITQGTLSHHMKHLIEAELVSCQKDGKWCHYSLVKENICEIADFIKNICCQSVDNKLCC